VILNLAVFSSRTIPQTGSLNDILGVKPQYEVHLQPFMVSGETKNKLQGDSETGVIVIVKILF